MKQLLHFFDDILQRLGYLRSNPDEEPDPFARRTVLGFRPRRAHAAGAAFALALIAALLVVRPWAFLSSDAGSPPRDLGAEKAAPPAAPIATTVRPTEVPAEDRIAVSVIRESRFAWPAVGELSSYFGPYHPTGIDIALNPAADSPIRASAAGVVSFAGGDRCCDFGYHVVIDHGAGASTFYGHLSKILVTEGQQVKQGDVIGLGGATGAATGKHLHFELNAGAGVVDPLRYLPAVPASPIVNSVKTASCPSAPIEIDPDSVVRLEFAAPSLTDYQVQDASVTIPNSLYFPHIDARAVAPLAVSLNVPPAPAASGETITLQLLVSIRKDDLSRTLTCPLSLTTIKTLPNPTPSPNSPGFTNPESAGTPTPTPTRTPIRPKPPATATPKPAATGARTATPAKK